MTAGSSAVKGDVLVLLGTRKGCFILSSDGTRKDWALSGPYCAGNEVFHMVYDHRDGGTVFAASNQMIWGPEVQISRDLGNSWSSAVEQPRFSGADGRTVEKLWHIEPGRDTQPGVLYADSLPFFVAGFVRQEIQGHILTLEYLRTVEDVRWTYISPAKKFKPGKVREKY